MKIELRNVKINLTFSEETIMFKADIVINGIVAGEAENDGHGGSTFYSAKTYDVKKQKFLPDSERERNKELIRQADEFCRTLPPIRVEEYDFEYNMNLEHFIDNLIDEEVNKKEQKKFEKKMVNHIMWGIPNGYSYSQVKLKIPLASVPLVQLQSLVNKYKNQLKKGEVFLNTNFDELGIKV